MIRLRLDLPHEAADDLPIDIPPYRLYDRVLVVEIADKLTIAVAFRWRPLARWRYLSRAWQGKAQVGEVLATDWTGRDRELIDLTWPVRSWCWTADKLASASFFHEFGSADPDRIFPQWTFPAPVDAHYPELTFDRF